MSSVSEWHTCVRNVIIKSIICVSCRRSPCIRSVCNHLHESLTSLMNEMETCRFWFLPWVTRIKNSEREIVIARAVTLLREFSFDSYHHYRHHFQCFLSSGSVSRSIFSSFEFFTFSQLPLCQPLFFLLSSSLSSLFLASTIRIGCWDLIVVDLSDDVLGGVRPIDCTLFARKF